MINWKRVCSVVFSVSKFIPNEEYSWIALISCFHLKKTVSYFEKLMMNMLRCKIRVNDGFGISKVVTSTQDEKKARTWKTAKKIRKCGISCIVGRR